MKWLKWGSKCKNCERLEAYIAKLEARICELEEKIARLSRNSANSSKPPSSDIVKPRKGSSKGVRKRGGQKGHPDTNRKPFPLEKVDHIEERDISFCPDCGNILSKETSYDPIVQQVIELAKKLFSITEYRRYGHWCPRCEKVVYAKLPDGVIEDQLCGPRLQTLMGYMKGALHASYTGLENFCREILGFDISRSLLCNNIGRLNKALETPYQELKDHIQHEPVLNIDETGWKDNGSAYWIWVFCNSLISFFIIRASRGSQVLKEVLGEVFNGAIVSDFFSAYVKYANELQQFCLAHLIRDIKFLTTLPDIHEQEVGQKLLKQFRHLFYFWHRKHKIPKEEYRSIMNKIKKNVQAIVNEPEKLAKNSATLTRRFNKHWDSIFRFLFSRTIPPTNNLAEQALRQAVIDRRITQGSRSETGRKWNARIWTVLSTCRKQERSAWSFLQGALSAYYFKSSVPTLIPGTA